MSRKQKSEDIDVGLSIESLEPSAAVAIARTKIRKFLTEIIIDKKTDVIISTLRKGSWIIDDFLKIKELDIRHFSANSKLDCEEFNGKHILIFDDSVHTGKSIRETLEKTEKFENVRVGCIVINDETKQEIEATGVSVTSLESFKDYTLYGKGGELIPGCQAYYYAHFMIPYVSNLSVNYSPDYVNLSLILESSSSKELETIISCAINGIQGVERKEFYEVDRTANTMRASVPINKEYLDRYLMSELGATYEPDISKLRVSATVYRNYSEIVITPMFCPICDDIQGIIMEDLPFILSKKFIKEACGDTIATLEKAGYKVREKGLIIGTVGNNESETR